MAKIFKAGKEYPADQLDFFRDLDKYELATNHVLVSYETRTENAVQNRRVHKTGNPSWNLSEAVYHCVRGIKKSFPKENHDNNRQYCPLKLKIRMNGQQDALDVKEWNHHHNHDPPKIKKNKKSWEKKCKDRINGNQKKGKGKGQKKERTLEEEIIENYLDTLRKNLNSSVDTLKEKLKLLKECGKKIAELDGKDLDFINIDSEDDDGKKSEQSEDEKEEEEMSDSNEQTTEIDKESDQNNKRKGEKRKLNQNKERVTENKKNKGEGNEKTVEEKKREEKDEGQTESGEKEIGKAKIEEKKEDEKDEGQTESGETEIHKESGGSNLSDMENMVTLKNMLENLVGQEITARCETGYIVSKEDLREINEGLLEFLRENATIVEGLEKMVEPEVLHLNFLIHNGAI
ncbi:suppressor of Mek1-like [Cotesia glomerata]|uniref:suppressor of Mek1-like n=1 Tax=Cotesia glomerata TaxID=32391 RepID=UPI001D018F7D|nr:suppressor of Mek1-like [Cotesia glomerata]